MLGSNALPRSLHLRGSRGTSTTRPCTGLSLLHGSPAIRCSKQRCLAVQPHQQPELADCSSSGAQCSHDTEASTPAQQTCPSSQVSSWVPAHVLLGACTALALPGHALAAEGLSGGAVDIFRQFLEQVEAMGPAGAVVFVLAVMLSEMIPLFPTQPLSLASGLLFGAQKGALLMLIGVTLAATNAFFISRGVGRPLAEKVIKLEMGGEGAESSSMASKILELQASIESGSPWQQFVAILLLRLTPVIPFSASNYILGLTPVQLAPLLGGTVAGMAVWSLLYASVGGASRSLLDNDTDIGTVFADLAEQSGALSHNVGMVALALGGVALVGVGATQLAKRSNLPSMDSMSHDDAKEYAKEEAYQKK